MSRKAQKSLKQFMGAWVKKDYQKMHLVSQETWKSEQKPFEGLNWFSKLTFGNVSIEDYKITGSTVVKKEKIIDFYVQVKHKEKWSDKGRVRVLCEDKPYSLSPEGRWGVNPVSATSLFHEIAVLES